MQQLIRDAYTSTPSTRGGMSADKSIVHALPTDSPIVISGEDMADEQSHRDRLIRVIVPRDGKGKLPPPGQEQHLGDLYFSWLVTRPPYESEAPIDAPPTITHWADESMPERQRYNLGLLVAGWGLLREFAEHIGMELRDPDFSGIVDLASDESISGTTAELLFDIYDRMPHSGGVTLDEEDPEWCHVQPNRVISVIRGQRLEVPFTNIKSLVVHLLQDLDGTDLGKLSINGKQGRYIRIKSSVIFGD